MKNIISCLIYVPMKTTLKATGYMYYFFAIKMKLSLNFFCLLWPKWSGCGKKHKGKCCFVHYFKRDFLLNLSS